MNEGVSHVAFVTGQRVWLLRSMRMCLIIESHADGTYTVEVMDSGRRLLVGADDLAACEGQAD